jgi:hypothetical protein
MCTIEPYKKKFVSESVSKDETCQVSFGITEYKKDLSKSAKLF